jgi:hypothetical protein
MRFNSSGVVCLGLLLILPSGCTVDRVTAQGRPCSVEAPCGPDTVCGPAGRCIPPGLTADGALDAPPPRDGAPDASWFDGPRADAPPPADKGRSDVGKDLLPEAATPTDKDADKVPDGQDNCVYKANPTQQDLDNDKVGDACDNCISKHNTSQADGDKDKVGDACDNCLKQANQGQADGDKDTVGDVCDNCPLKANKDQKNLDNDAHGDLCDADRDGDGVPNDIDPTPDVKDTVLYYKQPPVANDLEVFGGTWTAQSGAFCQMQTSNYQVSNFRARLKPALLSATDVLAQSRFSVKSIGPSTAYWPGAGMIVRVGDISGGNHDAYACYVDVKNLRLILGRYSNSNWNMFKAGNDNSVTSAGSYTMRVTVKGNNIGCELVPGGPSINSSHSQFTTGTVGFSTFRAAACYDYLLVLPAP